MATWTLAFAFGGGDSWWLLLLVIFLQALYTILFFRVLRPIMREVLKGTSDLDERQIAIRDRAHYDAYQVLGVIAVTIAAFPLLAALYGGANLPISLTHDHLQGLLLFLINLVVSLPASVVAWTEPDPSPDD